MSDSPPGGYPLDCWYIAARSVEIGRELVARTMLGRPIVLYRAEEGGVVALEDRCPHRAFPLSRGRLDGDQVVCGFHGFVYDSTGRCVHVPSQPHVPYGANVATFPVREVPPLIWLWPGDPDRAASTQPPSISWLGDPSWATVGGTRTVGANFMLLHENQLDITHLPFVAPGMSPRVLLGTPPPLEIEVSETSVSYSRTFEAACLPEWQSRASGFPAAAEFRQRETGQFVSPALWRGGWEIDAGDAELLRLEYACGFTPEGPRSTRVFWQTGRNFAIDDPTVTELVATSYEQILDRRAEVLEAVQANVHDTGDRSEVSVNADAAALRARHLVATMLAEQRGEAGALRARRRNP